MQADTTEGVCQMKKVSGVKFYSSLSRYRSPFLHPSLFKTVLVSGDVADRRGRLSLSDSVIDREMGKRD